MIGANFRRDRGGMKQVLGCPCARRDRVQALSRDAWMTNLHWRKNSAIP